MKGFNKEKDGSIKSCSVRIKIVNKISKVKKKELNRMPIQMSGLASGLDTESIINDLMKAERIRVDEVKQDKTLVEWTRDAYNDINQKFAEFVLNTRELFGLTDTSSGSMINKSVSSLKWIKGASSSNTGVADVSAKANAINGTYIVNVEQLATNWSAASAASVSIGSDKSNLQSQFTLESSDIVHFEIIAKNSSTGEQQTLEISIDSAASDTNSNSYVKIKDKDGNVVHTVDLEGNTSNISLNDIVKQINNTDIGVTSIYDESTDRFFLQTDKTGTDNTIQIVDSSALHDTNGAILTGENFINKLKLQYNNNGTMTNVVSSTEYTGQNAKIDFGAAQDIILSSNQFTINNMDFNLKSTGTTTITVSTDEDAVIDKITEFVDKYNDLVEEVNKRLSEKRYRDYPPLTDTQRDEMGEKEIDLWEEKARSGLLRNDSIISGTMQRIRTGLYERVQGVEGSFDHLTQIGITTENYNSGSAGGKLVIDENKLREALREDVDGVMELLFKKPDSSITDETEKRKNTGLVSRMYEDLINGMKEVIYKAGTGDDSQLYRNIDFTMLIDFVSQYGSISMLDERITDYKDRIVGLERRMANLENRYWRQFSAMEVAISNMNAQSSWLSSALGM